MSSSSSVSLFAVDGQLVVNYLSGNGVLTTNNDGSVTTANPVIESQLSTELQDKINAGGGSTNYDTIAPMITDVTTRYFSNFGAEWRTVSGTTATNIVGIACSGDGKVIVVCAWGNSNIPQISRDYGKTWSMLNLNFQNGMYSCSISFDGQIILASNSSNSALLSTDYGQTFASTNLSYASLVAISATGKTMMTGSQNGYGINVSTDYGSTWSHVVGSGTYNAVALSMDGSIMYAANGSNQLLKSVDNGINWTTMYNASDTISKTVCSATGQYVLLVVASRLYLSSDYGATFAASGISTSVYSCAMSSNGMYMISGSSSGGLFDVSTNYGQSWTSYSGSTSYLAVAMSNDGFHLYRMAPYQQMVSCYANSTIISTTPPAIPTAGSIYYDTTTSSLYVYTGTTWVSFSSTPP